MTESKAATQTLVIERDIPHPQDKIWRALTQSALIAEWLMPNDFEAKSGHAFNLRVTPPPMPNWNGMIDCKVLPIEPQRRLSYSWNALGLETIVTFTLTPTAAGVHLRMEQSGFASDSDNNYRGAMYGWQKFLGQLEQVVAQI
jgi:uncharacterized protein YndB with AHSA1/START domain